MYVLSIFIPGCHTIQTASWLMYEFFCHEPLDPYVFPLYAELIVAAPKTLSVPNLGFGLATPLLKCQLSPQCVSKRGTLTSTDEDVRKISSVF